MYHLLRGDWPIDVDSAIYLAGLLMQIRFGNFSPDRHKPGFLTEELNTFVPATLLHNQLKTAEWERRIFKAHAGHTGRTDMTLLHRLFLQYCWQWPFYGATVFHAELAKMKRSVLASRNLPVYVTVNADWLCVVDLDNNTLGVRAL